MKSVKVAMATLLAMTLALGVAGRAQAQDALTEAAVVGDWSADFAAMAAQQEMTPEERQAVEGMMAGAVANMSLNADHTATYHAELMGQVEDKAGTWALDPAANTLTMTDAAGQVDVLTIAAPDANTLVIGTTEGDSMIWRRAP